MFGSLKATHSPLITYPRRNGARRCNVLAFAAEGRTSMHKIFVVCLLVGVAITARGQVPNPPNSAMSLDEALALLNKRGYDPKSHPDTDLPIYTEEYEYLREMCRVATMCGKSERELVGDANDEHRTGNKECINFDGAFKKTSLAGQSMRVVCSELFIVDEDDF